MSGDDSSLTILVVDDSLEDRELLRYFLRGAAERTVEVLEASSIEEARTVCATIRPDCVLLDNRLPGDSGMSFLREISNEPHPPRFPTVMLTGTGDETLAVQAMKAGAQDYLVKGRVTGNILIRSIENAIEKVKLRRKIEDQRKELIRLACTDDLTGLTNRRFFMKRLQQETSRSRRYDIALTLLLLDVDHFKSVNDRFGHPVGDKVLTRVAVVMEETLRSSDVPARYGGEEFVALLPNTDATGGETIANRLREAIHAQEFVDEEGNSFQISCSIGVAELEPDMADWDKLLSVADEALYAAKRKGRNCVVSLRLAETNSQA